MKRICLICITILLGVASATLSQPAEHVVLITIDGFRSDFYLDESWGMVNLRQMKERGIYAEGVNPVFPSSTFPNHTTIMTGVRSAEHGIYYNNQFASDGTGEWFWYANSIQAPTLWDAVSEAGLKSVSVNWPVSVDAPIDYNIPIIKEPGISRLQAIKKHSKPEGLFEEIEQYATGKMGNLDFSMQEDYLLLDQNLARITAYLIKKYKPALTTVRLSLTDNFQHEQGRDGDKVRRVVAGADRSIKTILDGIERAGILDETAVIVTGDHGFVNRHTLLAPNVWLKRAGLIEDAKNSDWKAQFHTAGGSAFLQLKNPDDLEYLKKVKVVINDLPKGQRKLFRIVEGCELDRLTIDPAVPLALTAEQGVGFSSSRSGSTVRPASGGTHGYLPEFPEIQTGFVGYGAGFKQDVIIPVMDLEDVAPIITRLLGIKLKSADGAAFPGIFAN